MHISFALPFEFQLTLKYNIILKVQVVSALCVEIQFKYTQEQRDLQNERNVSEMKISFVEHAVHIPHLEDAKHEKKLIIIFVLC